MYIELQLAAMMFGIMGLDRWGGWSLRESMGVGRRGSGFYECWELGVTRGT